MKKGTYVSRSVYQHVKEENKKYLEDLKTICTGSMTESILVRLRWRMIFKHQMHRDRILHDLLTKCLKDGKTT